MFSIILITTKYIYDKSILLKIDIIDKQIITLNNEIEPIQTTFDNSQILIDRIVDAVDNLNLLVIVYSPDITYLDNYYFSEISSMIYDIEYAYYPEINNLSFIDNNLKSIKSKSLDFLNKIKQFYNSVLDYLIFQNEFYYNQSISNFKDLQNFGNPTDNMLSFINSQEDRLNILSNEVSNLIIKKLKLQKYLWFQ